MVDAPAAGQIAARSTTTVSRHRTTKRRSKLSCSPEIVRDLTMPKARKLARRSPSRPPASHVPTIAVDRLLGDIRALIETAREQTATAVNAALVGLYWNIGKRIRQDVLQDKRARTARRLFRRCRNI